MSGSPLVIGVDPGATGAIATIGGPFDDLNVYDMPTLTVKHGKTDRTMVNPRLLGDLLREIIEPAGTVFAVIEKVHSMPRDSSVSAFSFGRATGYVEMAIAMLGVPHVHVTPQEWQRGVRKGKGKDASVARALELYPAAAAVHLARKKDHNRADAILIAHWGLTRR